MNSSRFTLSLLIALTMNVACSTPQVESNSPNESSGGELGEPVPTPTPIATATPAPESADLSFCDTVVSVGSGKLCAIKPSALDSRTKDVYGTASHQDRTYGFGYHAIAIPNNYQPSKGLWIHFTGTYGRPFNQAAQSFSTSTFLSEIMEQGYTVIQVAYDNRFSVNDTCLSPEGQQRDNCAGEVREEVLTGVDHTPLRTTDAFNGVDYRLRVLLQFLKTKSAVQLPANLDPDKIVSLDHMFSGHSQGGNLAYYIAKFRGAKAACMLGSPYDVGDSVNPSQLAIADWFKSSTSLTPVGRLGQLITVEDDYYQSFKAAATYIGMRYGIEAFETSQPPYANAAGESINGHGASVGDPKLKALRAQACFRH